MSAAAQATDEPVWHLPLDKRYRKQLDSVVADMKNIGGEYAGAITIVLFLAEFVGDLPWAHLDTAGTAKADAAWRTSLAVWRCGTHIHSHRGAFARRAPPLAHKLLQRVLRVSDEAGAQLRV